MLVSVGGTTMLIALVALPPAKFITVTCRSASEAFGATSKVAVIVVEFTTLTELTVTPAGLTVIVMGATKFVPLSVTA
jgi:hypothetical protein